MPAVNSEGQGIPTQLTVEAMPGSGRIFVDIDGVCSNWMKSACHVCEIDEKNKVIKIKDWKK